MIDESGDEELWGTGGTGFPVCIFPCPLSLWPPVLTLSALFVFAPKTCYLDFFYVYFSFTFMLLYQKLASQPRFFLHQQYKSNSDDNTRASPAVFGEVTISICPSALFIAKYIGRYAACLSRI
ncbi:hypothetical protein V8F33_000408 [Rhypophila sp. PSN 637]